MPKWDVELYLPLAKETIILGEELVNDSTITVQGPDSLLFLSFDGSLEPLTISPADFSTDPIDTSYSFEIGTIMLNDLDVLETDPIRLNKIFPELANLIPPGQNIPVTIPDTTFYPPREELQTVDIKSAHILNATLQVELHNNLPFSIGPNQNNPQGAMVTISDSTGQTIAQFFVAQVVDSGEVFSKTVNLLNLPGWVKTPLFVEYNLPISHPTTFSANQNKLETANIQIFARFENLESDIATAKIPAQKTEAVFTMAVDEQYRVKQAEINSGNLQLQFSNNTSLAAVIRFKFNNFVTNSNQAYSDSLLVPAQSNKLYAINLNNFSVENPEAPNTYIDSFKVEYSVKTEKTENWVTLSASDGFDAAVYLSPLSFSSFAGFVAADTFEIDPTVEDSVVDYKNITNNFQTTDVDLNLKLQNEVYVENLLADLEITGYHRDKNGVLTDSATIYIEDQQINPGQPGNPGESYIHLSGEQVSRFLNILPTRIVSRGMVKASGEVSISNSSRIYGDYEFSLPLRVKIDGDALVEADPDSLTDEDIDQDFQDAVENDLTEAELLLKVKNVTPLGGSIELIVCGDSTVSDIYSTDLSGNPRAFVKELTLTEAPVDPQTGYVTTPTVSDVHLSLSREELKLFSNPPLKVGVRLKINGTATPIALKATDYVQISGLVKARVEIKEDI
ncbi:MAG: hypothetical protein Kow0037_02020 [Calditrichia bacterium]